MKKIALNISKALLIISVCTTGSVLFSTIGINVVSEACAAVPQSDVVKYLSDKGYTVISSIPIQGSDNWSCHTILNGINYTTTVFVRGTQIVGNSDGPF